MKTTLTVLSILLSFYIQAQSTKNVEIKIDTSIEGEALSIPFAAIQILDARFDKTKIGCIKSSGSEFFGRISFDKNNAVFPDSFKNYFPLFLNRFVKCNKYSKDSLFILVKEFRIADYLQNNIDDYYVELRLMLNIAASFYMVHDGRYYKLFSVEEKLMHDVSRFREKKNRKTDEGTRSTALSIMLYKLFQNKKWETNFTQRSFSLPEIQSAVEKRFNLPVFSEPRKQGLYKTFSDFKDNRPSSATIKVEYKGNQISRITNENSEDISTKGFWGMCDGNKLFMVFRNEMTELIPCDKSFRILFDRKEIASISNMDSDAGPFINTGTQKRKANEYFDLNMDNGKLYLEEIFGKSTIGMEISN